MHSKALRTPEQKLVLEKQTNRREKRKLDNTDSLSESARLADAKFCLISNN